MAELPDNAARPVPCGQVVMMPAIVVPPQLLNMKLLPEVDDVLGTLLLEGIGAHALIDRW